MIPDWHANCVFLAGTLEDRYPRVFKGLAGTLSAHGIEVRLLTNVKDIWAKDYCPVQVVPGTLVKFCYDPDYLRDVPELKTGDEVMKSLRGIGWCNRSAIILDGGNIVGSKFNAILTDKIYKENAGWIRTGLQNKLQKLLHVDQLIVIPKEPFDRIGHADGMVRFIDEHSVLVNDYSKVDPRFGERLDRVLRGHQLAIETLPYFHEKRTRTGIPSAVGCFINYLRTEKVLVAPVYGTREDDAALRKLETVFPRLPIVPLDCTNLAREGGVLNCVSATYHVSQNPPCRGPTLVGRPAHNEATTMHCDSNEADGIAKEMATLPITIVVRRRFRNARRRVAKKPLTGPFYWVPIPRGNRVEWEIMEYYDKDKDYPDGFASHQAVWPEVVNYLALKWHKPDAEAQRQLENCLYGLPRGRVVLMADGGYGIAHGSDCPVPGWVTIVKKKFNLQDATVLVFQDEHECMLPGQAQDVEHALGTGNLNLPTIVFVEERD